MRWFNPLKVLQLCYRSSRSFAIAKNTNSEGLQFGEFGKRLGIKLLMNGKRQGMGYLIWPVAMIRYYEFSFALRCLPAQPGQWLDVSSPRMFSFFAAAKFPKSSILIINPDEADVIATDLVLKTARFNNIQLQKVGVDWLESAGRKFDCIWSISVIEHISGQYEDDRAVKMMFDALRPGGRLILTTGVDRTAWDEYREEYYYGAPTQQQGRKYFFQRWYDRDAIQRRIIAPLGIEPKVIEWWGEKTKGLFAAHEQQAIKRGLDQTCTDAKEYALNYQRYNSWEEMPGIGVVGLMFEKPA